MPIIYIDADACPVKEETFRVAKRFSLQVYVVSQHKMMVPRADFIIPITVEKSFDSADHWIIEKIQQNDICITNDLLLSKACIDKKAFTIDPKGRVHDENTIGEALATRELMYELRQSGHLDLGPKKMGKQHRSEFLSQLDRLIHKIKCAK